MDDYQPSNNDNTSEDSFEEYSKQQRQKRTKRKSAVRKKSVTTISDSKNAESVKETSASVSKPTASISYTETSINKASPDLSKTPNLNLTVDRVMQIFSQSRDFFEMKLSGQTKSKLLIKSQMARLSIADYADQEFAYHGHIISDQTLRNSKILFLRYLESCEHDYRYQFARV